MITIISQPNNYHSGYNQIKYVIDSTNKNNPGFRYIVQLFKAGTAEKFAEFDMIPNPLNNGYGEINISKIIQTQLDYTINLTNFAFQDATKCYFNYDIKFGESFSTLWEFNDYVYLTGDTGNLGLTTDSAFGAGFQMKLILI